MAKDDWITWGLGGLVALVLGYCYITSQKAGAKGEAPKQGCGCQAEPEPEPEPELGK